MLVGLSSALVIAIALLAFRFATGVRGSSLAFEFAGVFVLSMAIVTGIVEILVYRRLKIITEKSEKEIQKLKEMEEYRREFLGNVSHELKTPIFAIEGFIDTLLHGAMNDKKVNRKFLQKALKHADRLGTLVEDILVISQVESGDLGMDMEQFRIHKVIRDVVESLDTKLTKKGRDIECRIVSNGLESTKVLADEKRIDQVLYNLIDNAVKYGNPQGQITIYLREIGLGKIEVAVADQGPGIDPKHLPRLFERFYRVDKSRSRDRGGTGLGLAICKHLIEAHNERIWVESTERGTTFRFTLAKAG